MGESGRSARVGASPGSVIALSLISFGAGAAGGAIGYHHYSCGCEDRVWTRPGTSWKADQIEHWTRELRLDAAQKESLGAALDAVYPRYRELYAEMAPRKRAVDAELQARVREFLNERQRARYDEALREVERRRAEYHGTIDPKQLAQPIRGAAAQGP